MTERRSDHLDPATIAALVDRTLDAGARRAAEAHLAVCAECREVWVETSAMAEAAGGVNRQPAGRVGAARRVPAARWMYAGAGLAAAAAIVFAVVLPRTRDRASDPDVRSLVEAVADNRRTEARLTGGFMWGERPVVTRNQDASAVSPEVRIAANEIRTRAVNAGDAASLRALAAAELLLGNTNAAIEASDRAVRQDPAMAAAWSDLSAALLERHRIVGNREDAERAYASAARAIELDPGLLEALFNQALALEKLERRTDAIAAWQRYLARDSRSPWATEAGQRLSALQSRG